MLTDQRTGHGKIGWRSPSNIALIKYWGKKTGQIPANPSLSMTLSEAYTEMTLQFCQGYDKDAKPWLEFFFEGRKQDNFENKISGFLASLMSSYPALKDYRFRICSSNTFPHSAGIASSASSMSALGLCLADFLYGIEGKSKSGTDFYRDASNLSRLASGSACRSVYGGFTIWGDYPPVEGSSDKFAVELPLQIHAVYHKMNDAILVVSSKEKPVSSRAGHSLMDNHPYASARYQRAVSNLTEMIGALSSGDLDIFIRITESEALNLHALMMTSDPSYLLIEPNTLNIVHAIRRFRKDTGIPVCFTLDAGPNIHLLYPVTYKAAVQQWIEDELLNFCEDRRWIDDKMGDGPEEIVFSNQP